MNKLAWMLPILLLAGCRSEPDEAPPIGGVQSTSVTTASDASPADAAATLAQRHADFRLAMRDARDALQAAWSDCDAGTADPAGCREHALAAYDTAIAHASRAYGVASDEVIDMDAELPASTTMVAFSGTRG